MVPHSRHFAKISLKTHTWALGENGGDVPSFCSMESVTISILKGTGELFLGGGGLSYSSLHTGSHSIHNTQHFTVEQKFLARLGKIHLMHVTHFFVFPPPRICDFNPLFLHTSLHLFNLNNAWKSSPHKIIRNLGEFHHPPSEWKN
jgi:hypothetical protein